MSNELPTPGPGYTAIDPGADDPAELLPVRVYAVGLYQAGGRATVAIEVAIAPGYRLAVILDRDDLEGIARLGAALPSDA